MEGFEKFNANPFSSIIRMQGEQQQEAGPQNAPNVGMQTEDESNQLAKGQTGDNSQNLMRALQALHKYIADSTDPSEISMGRGIILLLSKLIEKDQQAQVSKLKPSA